MVELVNKRSPQSPVVTSGTAVNNLSTAGGYQSHVKLEADDSANEECPSGFKRAKLMAPFQQQQWTDGPSSAHPQVIPSSAHPQVTYFNPLDEPSPLGLRLRKTPSLLDLIQMKLSQGDLACSGDVSNLNQEAGKRKDARSTMVQSSADKLKASNFPASILRIGTWECISRYEGDLVAKCYFAKHKLVWEVLDGGLKSKIEIQWSDITALRANYPENEPGTLDIEVSRPPLFFRETNPQPRKHTLWQATSDFTGGQATICKRHFLQCPQGLLNRHYEKLIQCDPRLNSLSKKAVISRDSPYFDSRSAAFQAKDEQTCYGTVKENKPHVLPQFDHLKNEYFTTFSSFQDAPPPVVQTLIPKREPLDPEAGIVEAIPQETPSPSSVMDSRAIEENGNSDNDELNTKGVTQWEQLRVLVPLNVLPDHGSGLTLPASMSTLVNQIGLCVQEQRRSCNSHSTCEGTCSSNKKTLDEIAQHLLGDSALSVTSDEQSILARVNSMCSLLQKDVSAVHALQKNAGKIEDSMTGYSLGKFIHGDDGGVRDEVNSKKGIDRVPFCQVENSSTDCKQATVVPRKESSGDLLLHLPRIASLPQFFVQASDEMVMRNEPPGTVGGNRFR